MLYTLELIIHANSIYELFKVLFFSLIEGVTEWLPVSSTGHLLIAQWLLPLQVSKAFWDFFLVAIQFGAILAVVWVFWSKVWPFQSPHAPTLSADSLTALPPSWQKRAWPSFLRPDRLFLWCQIFLASLPAAILGLTFEKFAPSSLQDKLQSIPFIAFMLILVGFLFLWIERPKKIQTALYLSTQAMPWSVVFWIGVFQLLAALLPGTSRSGATILGALMLGVSRSVATEFSFCLGIPAMAGASLIKWIHFGFHFSSWELIILLTGMLSSFLVSILVIRFLLRFIQKHSFRVFGLYRILFGFLLLFLWFLF